MNTIKSVTIHGNKYYETSELMKFNSKFFKGFRNGRDLIRKKSIEHGFFVYAAWHDNEWILKNPLNNNNRKSDKVFLSEDWVNANFPKEADIIESAPKIILLADNEKLRDDAGNIVNIEVRGERTMSKCYYRLHDIAKGFDIHNLYTKIITKKSYIKDIHYKYFVCTDSVVDKEKKTRNHKKQIFLTFEGLIKVFVSSNNDKVKNIVKMINESFYAKHMSPQVKQIKKK